MNSYNMLQDWLLICTCIFFKNRYCLILVSFFLFVFLRVCVCCFLLNACYLFEECFSVILTFSQFAVGHTCIVPTVLGSYLIIKLGHLSLTFFWRKTKLKFDCVRVFHCFCFCLCFGFVSVRFAEKSNC